MNGRTQTAPLVVASPDELDLHGTVISIGNFDGVHTGHRALLGRMRELSRELALPAVVLSFFPTSRMVFSGSGFLSDAREKVLLLQGFGPAAIALIPFSREYARTDKDEFLRQLERLGPAAVIVGDDFRFGAGRAGTLNDLSLVTPKLEVFGLLSEGGEVVSSSRIRELLLAGEVEAAARLLGEPYPAVGRVVAGERRGRTIGYPTANVATGSGKVLPEGVFAVRVRVRGDEGDRAAAAREYGGMASSGIRPTFPDEPATLEAYLFDFDGDLYDRELEVRFVRKLRDQVRYGGMDELRAALARDEEAARAALTQGAAS